MIEATKIELTHSIYIYIMIAGAVSTLIRVLPVTLIRRKIENKFIKSFLFYLPYVTLSVMTFPAILQVTDSPVAGIAAFAVGIVASWFGANLFQVALLCCGIVFLL